MPCRHCELSSAPNRFLFLGNRINFVTRLAGVFPSGGNILEGDENNDKYRCRPGVELRSYTTLADGSHRVAETTALSVQRKTPSVPWCCMPTERRFAPSLMTPRFRYAVSRVRMLQFVNLSAGAARSRFWSTTFAKSPPYLISGISDGSGITPRANRRPAGMITVVLIAITEPTSIAKFPMCELLGDKSLNPEAAREGAALGTASHRSNRMASCCGARCE